MKKEAEEACKDPHFWETQKPLPGAGQVIRNFDGSEFEVVIVTSPYVSCKEWGDKRRRWLDQNFGIDKNNVVITHKKYLVKGFAFVDDKPDHVEAWGAFNGTQRAFLFNQPYNKGASRLMKRINWDDSVRALNKLTRLVPIDDIRRAQGLQPLPDGIGQMEI